MHVVCVAGFMHSVMFAQCFFRRGKFVQTVPFETAQSKRGYNMSASV